ncbi:single-stranded DNA-binding protein [Corynebacterium sp. H130]|uniref:single-stranded DNA-binding protein n=1 Tax=Corynebacterium sp. H130 TaxID=3133444 RepID=UPI003096724C
MAQHSFTITGNIISDPSFHSWEDKAVYRMRVATSRPVRVGEEWVNYDQLYISVECWGELARNCRMSLWKGINIIATGTLVTHEWEDKDGIKQSRIVLKATHIGPDLGKFVVNPMRSDQLNPTKKDQEQQPDSTPTDEQVEKVLSEHEKEMEPAMAGASAPEEKGEPPF